MDFISTLGGYDYAQLQSFWLVLARFSGLFVSAPVLSNTNIPNIVKASLCIIFCIIVFPFVVPLSQPISSAPMLVFLMIKDFAVGLFFGFFISLIFVGLQLAGTLIDYQSGFGIVNVVDPESHLQVPLMGQFLYIIALLLFLIIDGHHLLLQSLVQSFKVLPIGQVHGSAQLVGLIIDVFSKVFILAIKISAPVVAALFLVESAYGVIARAVPQVNILIVGLPVKLIAGVFFIFLMLPSFFWIMKKEFFNVFVSLDNLMKVY